MKKVLILVFLFSNFLFSQDKIEVFFDFNSAIPTKESTDFFNKWMNENREVTITKLAGFCDSIDNSKYNKELALRRINNILFNLKESKINIDANLKIENNGKDFKQSKIQSENRKVIVYFEKRSLKQEVSNAKKGDFIKLKAMYFFNKSDKIKPESQPVLNELVEILRLNLKIKIEIHGHICCQNPYQPDIISEARAKAVYDFLLKNKIDKTRMTYKGFGVSKPVHKIPEQNEMQENENRRVEILIVEK